MNLSLRGWSARARSILLRVAHNIAVVGGSPVAALRHAGAAVIAAAPLLLLLDAVAQANAPFENTGYSKNVGFGTPMSTIAGLTDWAREINYVYGITAWICLGVFIAVAVPVVVAIVKFRVKPGHDDRTPPKQTHGNAALEFTWTIVPCILLVFIAIPTWRVIFSQPSQPPADALTIEVIGHQWWWEFRYPEQGVTTANELVMPENRAVFFKISSADVIHSFWVPNFGGKVDAMPGKDHVNTLLYTTPELAADKKTTGELYQGQCVELCGASHALMRFNARIVTAESFGRWVAAGKTPPEVVTESQRRGEALFAQCVACHTIAGTPSEQIPGDKIGPNLTSFGSRAWIAGGIRRNTAENLALWLANPPAMKPGSLMPNLGLSTDDIAALSAYLRQSTQKTY